MSTTDAPTVPIVTPAFSLIHKYLPAILMLGAVICAPVLEAQADQQMRTERIAFIQDRLDQGSPNAKLWWWGWLGGYAAITVGQMGLYYATPADTEDNKTLRDILVVGAASSFLGVLGQVLTPMTPAYAGDELRALPANTAGEQVAKLSRAEKLLIESAEREKFGRSWIAHAACVAVNLGAGLIIWQGMHHTFLEGFANFAGGMLISEIQIFTQPMQAVRDLEDYRAKYGTSAAAALQKENNWFVQLSFTGFRAGVYF